MSNRTHRTLVSKTLAGAALGLGLAASLHAPHLDASAAIRAALVGAALGLGLALTLRASLPRAMVALEAMADRADPGGARGSYPRLGDD